MESVKEHEQWLVEAFPASLTNAFEAACGERPSVTYETSQEPPVGPGLYWKQSFSSLHGEIWLCASESSWQLTGSRIVGTDGADSATLKTAYLETVDKVWPGVAQLVSNKFGIESVPLGGKEHHLPPMDLDWTTLSVAFSWGTILFWLGCSKLLLPTLLPETTAEGSAATVPQPQFSGKLSFENSRTFELLLDVELPVSVSFGRAQVPLKDVLKLTTGSIVELNRSIVEPVEVIVNNCVIARGEVVVVEGNFGVRIQQVISRQERLRTLS